jgi:hypothetical protein
VKRVRLEAGHRVVRERRHEHSRKGHRPGERRAQRQEASASGGHEQRSQNEGAQKREPEREGDLGREEELEAEQRSEA